jgi:phosphoacetylglucosamine mutase
MNYGTAGFRSNYKDIINISFYVGFIVSLMCHKNKKNYGIMITASHNEHNDNGLKIVDNYGHMISKEEEDEIINFILNKEKTNVLIDNNNNYKIFIGRDTRKSSLKIFNEIEKGIGLNNIEIIDLGLVTTPEHHYKINNNFYITSIIKLLNDNDNKYNINIDCANGVGYTLFNKIFQHVENKTWNKINLINIYTDKYELLNYECGTDYFINNKNNLLNIDNGIYGSIDGDADRSIFFNVKNNKIINLFDGDTLSIIYLHYLIHYCKLTNKDIVVVYTSYSNSGFIDFINKNYLGVILKCSKTGVKNCEKHAKSNCKVGIYFENNGHGTVLNNGFLNLKLLNFINPIVGDGVINIFLILILLNVMNLDFDDFNYEKYKLSNYKIKLNKINGNNFINDENETGLLKPDYIVNKINELKITYNLKRIFIRKSGTENVLRILIEGNDYEINDNCFKELETYILQSS